MKIIGLMSGTSADGIDAAICEISGAPPRLDIQVLATLSLPYDAAMQRRIFEACQPHSSSVESITRLNADLGRVFGQAASALLDTVQVRAEDVALIASHGQTVWHDVDAMGQVHATLQIGSPAVIAEHTGITTISDFRSRDVSAGGQGAPLTAYVDWLLLRRKSGWRAVQNIGGMGNVTLLPPLDVNTNADPIAFDTGPGNALIDVAVRQVTQGTQGFDVDGQRAARGTVNTTWLNRLLAHPYYHRQPPKTTGRELFGDDYAKQLIAEAQYQHINDDDMIATLTALTAHSIARAYADFSPVTPKDLVLGGGGARNPTLINMLRDLLPGIEVLTHEALGIDSDFKEALVFAVLGYETWHHRPGTLTVITGAKHARTLGSITPGTNFSRLIQETWPI